MATSLKKQRVIDAAGVLADALVESGLKPSELMDVGDALDQKQDLHRRRAESLMAIATMLRADAMFEAKATAGVSWTPPGDEEDNFNP